MNHVVSFNKAEKGSQLGSQKTEYLNFTDRSIKHLRATEKRRVVWAKGLAGFGIRISPSGTKSFVYKFDVDGRDRWLTLGRYPKMRLADALQKYGELLAKVEAGIDPADDHVAQNSVERNLPLFAELAHDYIEIHAKPNKRSWKEDQRQLDKDILPKWRTRIACKITDSDAEALIQGIVERGAPIQANRTLALLKKIFNFGLLRKKYNIKVSPVHLMERPLEESPRERFLSLNEVGVFWRRSADMCAGRTVTLALQLLLLTMQRSTEVAHMHVSEFDPKAETWIIPGTRTKNKQPHLVPLSPPALKIVCEAKEDMNDDGYLFPGKRKETLLNPTTVSHSVSDNLEHFGIPKFTPHDFRRTGSTLLGAFKVPRFDRERVLNHTDRGIGAVYDLYDYEDEKRAALTLWADVIQHCAASTMSVDEKKLKAKLRYQDYLAY